MSFQKNTPNPGHSITLTGKQLSELGMILGGRSFKDADDVIKAFRDYFTVSVSGVATQLDPEDARALKDQYGSFPHYTYDEYVSLTIQEALTQYLWGSTKGILV